MDNSRREYFDTAQSSGRNGRDTSAVPLREALRALTAGGAASTANMTPEQLAELAQRLSGAGASAAMNLAAVLGANAAGASAGLTGVQYVVYSLDEMPCALPGEAVQGIERLPDVTPVPNVASWVLGVVPLRGAVLSVVDLRAFLDLPRIPVSSRSRLLVVNQRGMTIGFVVDAILELRSDKPADVPTVGASLAQWIAPYGAGVVELGGRQVQLIDVQRLLFADKMQHYSTYVA